MAFFVDCFGPYPYASYDVVVTDDALEIPLSPRPCRPSGPTTRPGTGRTSASSPTNSPQWFGNCLTAAQWRDIWCTRDSPATRSGCGRKRWASTPPREQAARHHQGACRTIPGPAVVTRARTCSTTACTWQGRTDPARAQGCDRGRGLLRRAPPASSPTTGTASCPRRRTSGKPSAGSWDRPGVNRCAGRCWIPGCAPLRSPIPFRGPHGTARAAPAPSGIGDD